LSLKDVAKAIGVTPKWLCDLAWRGHLDLDQYQTIGRSKAIPEADVPAIKAAVEAWRQRHQRRRETQCA
jgi:hypothetical protein